MPVRMLVSRHGAPQLIRATKRFAEQLGLAVEPISGADAPYLQQPETFAEELRAILRQLEHRISPRGHRGSLSQAHRVPLPASGFKHGDPRFRCGRLTACDVAATLR